MNAQHDTTETAQTLQNASTTAAEDRLRSALAHPRSSSRLSTVLAAGTRPDPAYAPVLLEALGTEPDFYVRDMLTWALTRHADDATVPPLLEMVTAPGSTPAARAQALHTLSKIADPRGWAVITDALLADPDDQVARTAWRTAAVLVPEAERANLARRLTGQLGRGDRELQRSLSRVFVDLADVAVPALTALAGAGIAADDAAGARPDDAGEDLAAAHARATLRLIADPDAAFTLDVEFAKRVDALGGQNG